MFSKSPLYLFLRLVKKWPLISFFGVLAMLVGLVAMSNLVQKRIIQDVEFIPGAKKVKVYKLQREAMINVQGRVEKTGVVAVSAQTAGLVYKINVKEGQPVSKGRQLVKLSNTALGGNAASIQRKLAQAQDEHVIKTVDLQSDLLEKQRRVAELTKENAEQIRDLGNKAAEDTRGLISANERILGQIDQGLIDLEEGNINGANDVLIFQSEQLRVQYLNVIAQLQSGLRNSEYQTSDDKPPADLVDLQKELTLKQLDLQLRALELNKKTSHLQLRLAQISEAMMFPVAPISGVVEYVHVRENQTVSPGAPLVTIAGEEQGIQVSVLLPDKLARQVSRLRPGKIYINGIGEIYESMPDWISNEAVENQLFAVIYSLPDKYRKLLADGEYLSIDLPLGESGPEFGNWFVPLDAVYQTQNQAFVLVAEEGKAVVKQLKLGEVIGSHVYVLDGLEDGEMIIIDRTIMAGEEVEVN